MPPSSPRSPKKKPAGPGGAKRGKSAARAGTGARPKAASKARSGAKRGPGAQKAKEAPRPAPRAKHKKSRALPVAAPRDRPGESPLLTEEERIESAKYAVGSPRRVFEAERFIFPESYGVNRVRLLVKDPDWLFAHWDVRESALQDLKAEVGARAVELSRLTLRVVDPGNGGMSVVLLPPGARSWYVRADTTRRSYRAELGLTLPSGEFRRLAESNTVMTPRVGPAAEGARRRMPYRQGASLSRDAVLAAVAEVAATASVSAGRWNPVPDRTAPSPSEVASPKGETALGGSSETFVGGASDVYRR